MRNESPCYSAKTTVTHITSHDKAHIYIHGKRGYILEQSSAEHSQPDRQTGDAQSSQLANHSLTNRHQLKDEPR